MGIPSYFSYIIKTYTNIIRKRSEPIQQLLMDCNSIIYDAYREIEEKYKKEPFDIESIEDKIIQLTIDKIIHYIELISPSKCAYITFDGVAPFAKMDQQRIRRYKTQFINEDLNPLWNTTAITPGTQFMIKLSSTINSYFLSSNPKYINKFTQTKILLSCSDEPGEGEHKLFHYLRNIDATKDNVAVYGLDADLIMLSLFHYKQTHNIYVFREAPTFKSVISSNYGPNEVLFMDIGSLANSIFKEMGNYKIEEKEERVNDYVLMCFLLGNDFLPHLVGINIRTHGMQILTDTYYNTIGKYSNRSLIKKGEIEWKNVYILIREMAKEEEKNIKKECIEREKKEKWLRGTKGEKEISNIPIILREEEKYVNIEEKGWEKRYYRRILKKESEEEIKEICKEYLQGIEWVLKYYTGDCINWKWKYSYSYGPLLCDLQKYISFTPLNKSNRTAVNSSTKLPVTDLNESPQRGADSNLHWYKSIQSQHSIHSQQNNIPFEPITQLIYVLPPSQLILLPLEIQDTITQHYSHLYPIHYSFQWAFCRYFWEAHPILPEIPLSLLHQFNSLFIK